MKIQPVLLIVLFVGICMSAIAQTSDVNSSSAKNGSTTADAPVTSATSDPGYVIGPQDTLHINVWKEADLSSSVPVRPDGKISIPLLNDVQAAGLTAMQLANSITSGLKKYVDDPRVTVVVTAINSRRVYVLGEVRHPGGFSLLPNMTISQAIADAGGPTEYAHTNRIYVLRKESGKQIKHSFNYNNFVKGKGADQDIALLSGDTVVVP